ncbi:MAG: DUF2232 domain-containing protein [Synechococcus sp.]
MTRPLSSQDSDTRDDRLDTGDIQNLTVPGDRAIKKQALRLVEIAFLSSAAALAWVVTIYLNPTLPLLRLFFPLPVAISILRWDWRTGRMALAVSTLLLTVLIGPTRSVVYLMPYGLLGFLCGYLWQKRYSWYWSVLFGSLLSTLGLIFQLALSSVLVGENLWAFVTLQLAGVTNWLLDVTLGRFGIHVAASTLTIQMGIVVLVLMNSLVYVFTMHLVAALVMEKLDNPLPPPPKWVQVLLA